MYKSLRNLKPNFKTLEILVVCLITSIFIYFRKLDYYETLPRLSIGVSIVIFIWTLLVLRVSPWFLPTGLVLLNLFGVMHNDI
jgi:hypothetical protein|tara:strand:- start:399 stop:647 length:249 start_codon:yes stop_codon:yes gene_type:complete